MGGEGDNIPITTVTTKMTSALRWAVIKVGTKRCPQTTTFEEKGEPKQIRTEVPLLTSLTPYLTARPNRFMLAQILHDAS